MGKLAKEIRAALKLIYASLLVLERFPLPRIQALMKAFKLGISKTPITPEMQVLLDMINVSFPIADTAITTKNVDISKGSSDVVKVKNVKKILAKRLNSLKSKVIDLVAAEILEAILVLLKFEKISFYYIGGEATLMENLVELERKFTITPEISTLLPFATALKTEISNALTEKKIQFNTIGSDRTDSLPLIYDVRTSFLTAFGKLHGIYSTNLAKIVDLLPMDTLYKDIRSSTFLYKNQLLITNPISTFFNIVQPKFTYGMVVIIENMGPEALKIFLSLILATESPLDAITIDGLSKEEIVIADLGSIRDKYLMLEFLGSLELVNVKITIKYKKKVK